MKRLWAGLKVFWVIVWFPCWLLWEAINAPWECRQFLRQLAKRPRLGDEDFYERFYAGSGIPTEIPIRLRRVYVEQFGRAWAGVEPDDVIDAVLYDLDLYDDLLFDVRDEFGLKLPDELPKWFDGSFGAIVQLVAMQWPKERNDRQPL